MKLESEQLDKLLPDYIKLQGKLEAVPKDSENPHFRSRYADLAAVTSASRAELLSHGFALSHQPTIDSEGRRILITTLWHSSGQFLRSVSLIEPEKPTFQSVGSAITYTRRYDAMALLGLVPDDDDGHAAGATAPPRQAKSTNSPPPAKANGSKAKTAKAWDDDVEAWSDRLRNVDSGKKVLEVNDHIIKHFGASAKHKDIMLSRLCDRIRQIEDISEEEATELTTIIRSKMSPKMAETEAQAAGVFV